MYILYLYFKYMHRECVNPLVDSEPADPSSRDERIQIQGIVASKFYLC